MTPRELDLVKRLQRTLESGRNESPLGAPFSVPCDEYTDGARYARERDRVLRRAALPLMASRTLDAPGTMVAREILGVPLVATRDLDGNLRVFRNRCRHRGAVLLSGDTPASAQCLVCPYHGWTYALDGAPLKIPERETGFPGLDDAALSLTPVPSRELGGVLWISLESEAALDRTLDGVRSELAPFDLATCRPFDAREWSESFNWKLGVNSFLENYHFKFAHRTSVAQVFVWNRILVDPLGEHLRITLPRVSLPGQLARSPIEQIDFRPHVSFVYFIYPCAFLSILPDHASLVTFVPTGLATTRVESLLLVPDSSPHPPTYWEKNSAIFQQTVFEDLALSSSIQKGLTLDDGGAFTLATFEHGLAHFRDVLRRETG